VRKQTRQLVWLGLLTFFFSRPAAAAVPEWARQAAGQSIPTYDAETNAVVLLDETSYTVTAPTEYVERYRRVVKILRPDGRNEGDLSVYLREQDKLLSIHAWTIDGSSREYEVKDKEFAEKGEFDYELYSDVRQRTAQAPATQPGSIIAFEYEVRRHEWLNQLRWSFQEDIPIREARLIVQLPAGWQYKTSWASSAPVEPVGTSSNRWQWAVRDVPRIEPEPMMPYPGSIRRRMKVDYFASAGGNHNAASWEGLGRWYVGLTADRKVTTPGIAEKARQLTAGVSDFDGKLRALTTFLQSEVRYVAIEIGIGGWQPHAAADVFRARYGDCKDKATLLSSMLQEVGIRSYYSLISTHRGMADPAMPARSFNHAIVAIELPSDGHSSFVNGIVTTKSGQHLLLFDPTDEHTPVGELRSELQDSYALLVTESEGELIRTPLLPPDASVLSRSGLFTLSSDGALSGEVVEDRSGDHALWERYALIYANQQERTQRLEKFLNRSLKSFTLQSSDIQYLDDRQHDLVRKFSFTTPQYGQVRGPLMLVRPRVLGEKGVHLDSKPRRNPVEFEGASRETDTYEIEIPPDYKVDDIPAPVNVDVGFASYQSKIELSGSKLRYWREYTVRELRVNPDRIADLRKLEQAIGADESAAVVLIRSH
jgi:hypothetical protein